MKKQKQLTIRLNEDLYKMAMGKCNDHLGISLSALVKVFLRAFVSQKGVGFYIGDEDLSDLFRKWMMKKKLNKKIPGSHHMAGPFLKDLYDL
ncbi:hypothetical protein KJ632_04490 [Patescibacteria group bacterium]|nr:hypothetical protein [Patescibacteria group bacterium]